MATQTTNLKLTKPAVGDKYDVGVMNTNMDLIDAKFAGFGQKYTYTVSVQIGTDWKNTGICKTHLSNGAYILHMTGIWDTDKSWQKDNQYAGIMAWFSSGTNSEDNNEIPLHYTGHAQNDYTIQLRTHTNFGNTDNCHLQIKSNKNFTRATEIQFTFVKIV